MVATSNTDNHLSNLKKLDRSWSALLVCCVVLEISLLGFNNPFWQGIKGVNRTAFIAVSAFKYCKYRIENDVRSEVESELRVNQTEQSRLVNQYRYQLEELNGKLENLTEEKNTLQSIVYANDDIAQTAKKLNALVESRNSEIENLQNQLIDFAQLNKRLLTQKGKLKKYIQHINLASKSVIVDLIQYSLKQQKSNLDLGVYAAQQKDVLNHSLKVNTGLKLQIEDVLQQLKDQQMEHEEIEHKLRLDNTELESQIRINKQSRKFSDD